jgi:hypothetical protein
MTFKKHSLSQNICLVPTLIPVNNHSVERSDRAAECAVGSARLCIRRTSMKDLTFITFLVLVIFYSNSLRSLETLVPLFVFIFVNNWESSLLFNHTGHHLTCLYMIRRTTIHTEHFKYIQAHKLQFFYILWSDITSHNSSSAELLNFNYYGMSYLHTQIIMLSLFTNFLTRFHSLFSHNWV